MFSFFIVLRGSKSPHRAQHGPQEGPKNDPNPRFRLIWGLPFSASMLESPGRPIWDRFWAHLGASWGPSWALWAPTCGLLGTFGAPLGPSWAHLGGQLGSFRALMAVIVVSFAVQPAFLLRLSEKSKRINNKRSNKEDKERDRARKKQQRRREEER